MKTIVEYASYLYDAFNVKLFPQVIDSPNEKFDEFLARVYRDFGQSTPTFNRIQIEKTHLESPSPNDVMVAYSGGKDSAAVASFLQWETEYNPHAFYITDINKSYKSECDSVRESLDAIGIDESRRVAFSSGIKRNSKCEFIENPFKNFLIMTYMASCAFERNICAISMGEYPDEKNDFISAYSDNFGVIALYVSALKTVFPQLKYLRVFNNEVEALFYLILKGRLVGKWQSCILPDYRRGNVRKANIKRYPEYEHTFLTHPGKCLGCYKCLQEWFFLSVFGKIPINNDVVKKCKDAWRRQYAKDNNVDIATVDADRGIAYMFGDLPRERISEISSLDNLVAETRSNMDFI